MRPIESKLETRRFAQQALPALAVGDASAERFGRALQSPDAAEAGHFQDIEGIPPCLFMSAAGLSPRAAATAAARIAARNAGDPIWADLAKRWAAIESGGKETALV